MTHTDSTSTASISQGSNGSGSAPESSDPSGRPANPLFPQANVGLLYRVYEAETQGKPLTEQEQEAWDEAQRQGEEAERRRDLLGLVDLVEVMEDGVTEPEMLVEGELVEGEHHLVYGTKESGKTWLVLHWAVTLIDEGKTVIWVDKEMGRRNISDRLLTLGATPEQVGGHFVYMEFPSMDTSRESAATWKLLLDRKDPALVVVDAQTEVLADAGLNENMGTDIEKWSQAYITPARRMRAATVMIDHTGHSEQGRAVASRQKGAAAKVELSVVKDEKFDRATFGQVTVEVTKNTVSAPIPQRQSFQIGGDGEGGFVLEPGTSANTHAKASERAEKEQKVRAGIVEVVREEREVGSLRQLAILVRTKLGTLCGAERFNEIAVGVGKGDMHPEIGVELKSNGGYRFRYVDSQGSGPGSA